MFNHDNKKSPFIISVNKYETDNFMNDIIKGALKLKQKNKNQNKILFAKSFLFGFVISLFCFLLYWAYHSVSQQLPYK